MAKVGKREAKRIKRTKRILKSLMIDCKKKVLINMSQENRQRHKKLMKKCYHFEHRYNTKKTAMSKIYMLVDMYDMDIHGVVQKPYPLMEYPDIAMYNPQDRIVETPKEFYQATQVQNVAITPSDGNSPMTSFFITNEKTQECHPLTTHMKHARGIVTLKDDLPKKKAIKLITKSRKTLISLLEAEKHDNKEKGKDKGKIIKRRGGDDDSSSDSSYVYSYDDSDDSGKSVSYDDDDDDDADDSSS